MSGTIRGTWDLSRREGVPATPSETYHGSPRQRQRFTRFHPDGHGSRLRIVLVEVSLWTLGVFILAFCYARRPLALLLAIYIAFYAAMITRNMIAQSIHVTLSPLCRLPGATLLDLPFCGPAPSPITLDKSSQPVMSDFDSFINLQGKVEQVFEKSASIISSPNQMKRSETTIRDLRTLVKSSDLPLRWELVREFDGYIRTSRRSTTSLQEFIGHCDSAIDSIISINQWILGGEDFPTSPEPGVTSRFSTWFYYPTRYSAKPYGGILASALQKSAT